MRVVNELGRRYCLLQCLKCFFEIRNCRQKDLSPAHSATFIKLVEVCSFFPSEWKILESPAKFLVRTHFNIRCHPTQYCKSSYFSFLLSLTLHICIHFEPFLGKATFYFSLAPIPQIRSLLPFLFPLKSLIITVLTFVLHCGAVIGTLIFVTINFLPSHSFLFLPLFLNRLHRIRYFLGLLDSSPDLDPSINKQKHKEKP